MQLWQAWSDNMTALTHLKGTRPFISTLQQQVDVLYLYPGHTVDPLWNTDCHRVILVDRQVRGRAIDWSSCWTGLGLRESGCLRCVCCCCAAGEGRVPVAHQEPQETAQCSQGQTERGYIIRQRQEEFKLRIKRQQSVTFSSSFSPLSLIKTFSSSWLMPSMLLGTLEIEGFGTVMLDSGIWDDFDMENCCRANTHSVHWWKRMACDNLSLLWWWTVAVVTIALFIVFLCVLWIRQTHYLNVAGCGGVVGSAGEGRKGDGVELERGELVVVFTVSISLFTALELLPELCNLLESSRRT